MLAFKKYFKNEDGATAVEFAMVSVLFLLFIFGIIESGRVYWTLNSLEYAMQNTARYAMVHQSATNSELVDYAIGNMSDIQPDVSTLTVTTSTTTVSGVDFIEVEGTYTFTTIFPFFPAAFNSINLSTTVRIPYVL